MNYLNIGELKRLKDEGMYDEGGKHARLREGATITIEQGFLGFTANDNGKFPNRDLERLLAKYRVVTCRTLNTCSARF